MHYIYIITNRKAGLLKSSMLTFCGILDKLILLNFEFFNIQKGDLGKFILKFFHTNVIIETDVDPS